MGKKKIVVLNSGGFDSTVLLHHVRNIHPDADLYSLFFDYGQRSLIQEEESSSRNARKLSAHHCNIKLPRFYWTESNFYGKGYEVESQYLEWRNLIFLSFAMSFAQAMKAGDIYLAVLKSHHGYKDTSEDFLKTMNSLDSDIEIHAPFAKCDKKELSALAFYLGVAPRSYHSCDVPDKEGAPCGECPDCMDLKDIEEYLTMDEPIKAFRQSRAVDSQVFIDTVLNSKPTELRLLINNDCQLHCSHCFYGFEDMNGKALSKEEMVYSIREAVDYGVESIHISGKEPLYDDSIFYYIKAIRDISKDINIDVVTNGINLPKYAHRLKESGVNKIFLSIDDVLGGETSQYRQVKFHTEELALAECKKVGLPVEVFVDLHQSNIRVLSRLLHSLEERGVTNIYLRVIKHIGSAKANDLKPLTVLELCEVVEKLKGYQSINEDLVMTLNFGLHYSYLIRDAESLEVLRVKELIESILYTGNPWINHNLKILPEFYCASYMEQVTLTPDGFLLGCATDVSNPCYSSSCAGNIRESSFEDLVEKGKRMSLKYNESHMKDGRPQFICCKNEEQG